jgi:UDP-N-acetylmuramate--alanine ligase
LSLSINGKTLTHIHFVGILGAGMSAIAQYCAWEGLIISGSDRLGNAESTAFIQKTLTMMGCKIFPQDGSGIGHDTDAVVLSTAIEESNPDIGKARSFAIPLFHRSDVLSAIVASKKTIAVAGTSGKSTVSAMLFHVLGECGLQPSLIGGANLHSLADGGMIGNAFHGSSELLIIEADESDGTLVKYAPWISIVLNCSLDHKPIDEVLEMFRTLATKSKHVFTNDDCEKLRSLSAGRRFGVRATASFHPDTFFLNADAITIVKESFTYRVPFPGLHVVENALAVLAVCSFLGCDRADCAKAMASYRGIQRRFDRIMTRKGVCVIDDYAHNPDKIRATLKATHALAQRNIVLFQPHGFGPTRFMLTELIAAFNESIRETDTLFLLPIYYAGGTATRNISSGDIAAGLTLRKECVILPEDRNDAIQRIALHVKKENVVISMGARDPSLPLFAQAIADAIDRDF